jgi:hypothetical protein
MRKIISFIWLVLRILIYMIILLILLDDPILYPICVILFTYIEFKDKVKYWTTELNDPELIQELKENQILVMVM